ncbi:hypothetical protein QJQ45_024930, partial [Haematococcus lacustris]
MTRARADVAALLIRCGAYHNLCFTLWVAWSFTARNVRTVIALFKPLSSLLGRAYLRVSAVDLDALWDSSKHSGRLAWRSPPPLLYRQFSRLSGGPVASLLLGSPYSRQHSRHSSLMFSIRAFSPGAVRFNRAVVASTPKRLAGLGTSPCLPLPLFPRLSVPNAPPTSSHQVRAVGCAAAAAASVPSPQPQGSHTPLSEAQQQAPEAPKATGRAAARQSGRLDPVASSTAATTKTRTKRKAASSGISGHDSSNDSSGMDPALMLVCSTKVGRRRQSSMSEHSSDGISPSLVRTTTTRRRVVQSEGDPDPINTPAVRRRKATATTTTTNTTTTSSSRSSSSSSSSSRSSSSSSSSRVLAAGTTTSKVRQSRTVAAPPLSAPPTSASHLAPVRQREAVAAPPLPTPPSSRDQSASTRVHQPLEVEHLPPSHGGHSLAPGRQSPAPFASTTTALNTDRLSQQQQDLVNDPARAKLIQAVAGSGKTEVLVHIALKAAREGTNVLFVTKVSSVTFEIMNRLKSHLDVAQFGKSGNHYYHRLHSSGAVIEVANYDAMVHTQLLQRQLGLQGWLQQYGDAYSRKAERLCELVRSGDVTQLMMQFPKGTPAGMVLVDEMQDFNSTRVEIIARLAAINPKLKVVACGDALQSVFNDVINEEDAHLPGQGSHALSTWDMVPDMQHFSMDVCRRCPDPHVRFANAAMRSMHGGKHRIQPMKSSHPGVPGLSKPFLFAHPDLRLAPNSAASITAEQVCIIIQHFMQADSSLKPQDVAIIAMNTNSNAVFGQLGAKLPYLYSSHFGTSMEDSPSYVKHFVTKSELATTTMDWSSASGKTVMLSVHGDKGRSHKLVVVLNLSYEALPSKNAVDTALELVDASIVNVSLTRSERYLAVGVPASGASFYLNPALPGGKAFEPDLPVVASWQAAQLPKDSPFRSMAAEIHRVPGTPKPSNVKLYMPAKEQELGPSKWKVQVSTDIAHDFEHPTDLYPELFKRTSIRGHQFGTPFSFTGDAGIFSLPSSASGVRPSSSAFTYTLEAAPAVIGHMANLLLERLHCQRVGDMAGLRAKFDYLIDTQQHHYTSSELLNVSADQGLNELVAAGQLQEVEWLRVLQEAKDGGNQTAPLSGLGQGPTRHYLELSREVQQEVQELIQQQIPKYILPPYCSTDTFQASVEDYLSDKPCEDLHPSSMWHMAVAEQLLHQELRRPVLD